MSLKSGFYNSMNGDRKYNAYDMSGIFDGLINDGVFASVGSKFSVIADIGNTVIVGTGRAWFNRTWTYNDSALNISLDDSDLIMDRIDSIILEINSTDSVRKNTIKVIKGTASTEPEKPSLIKDGGIYQYPLAYIRRPANSNEINQSNITNAVGTSECPYVTGLLETTNIDELVAQWQGMFDEWFIGIKGKLDGDTAGKLSNDLVALENKTNEHLGYDITSEEGAHNLRVQNDKIQIKNEEDWNTVEIGTKIIEDGVNKGTVDSFKYESSEDMKISLSTPIPNNYKGYYIYSIFKLNEKIYAFINNSSSSYIINMTDNVMVCKTPVDYMRIEKVAEYNGKIYFYYSNKLYNFNGTTITEVCTAPFSADEHNIFNYKGRLYILAQIGSSSDASVSFYEYTGSAWSVLTNPPNVSYGVFRKWIELSDGMHFFGYYYYRYSSNYYYRYHYKFNGETWTTYSNVPSSLSEGDGQSTSDTYGLLAIKNILYIYFGGSQLYISAWDINNKRYINSSGKDFGYINYTYTQSMYETIPIIGCDKQGSVLYDGDNIYLAAYSYESSNYNNYNTRLKRIYFEKMEPALTKMGNGNRVINSILAWKKFNGSSGEYIPKCNEIMIVYYYSNTDTSMGIETITIPYEVFYNTVILNNKSLDHLIVYGGSSSSLSTKGFSISRVNTITGISIYYR